MQKLEEDIENLVLEVKAVSKLPSSGEGETKTFEELKELLAVQMEQLIFIENQTDGLSKKITDIKNKI